MALGMDMEPLSTQQAGTATSPDVRRQSILAEIARLERLANRPLYNLALFIGLSIAAQSDFAFLPPLSAGLRDALGAPPSPPFISIALVVYVFSAVILSLSRMMAGSGKVGGLAHLGYLAAFYLFYHLSAGLAEYFWAVFAAGMTILLLETYQLRTFCQEAIRRERDTLAQLERQQLFSP